MQYLHSTKMSIENFIRRVCVQQAVYWGNPVEDGFGGKTYASPVEIACRWEDKVRKVKANDGSEIESKATVLVTQDLDFEGYLYLGTLEAVEAFEIAANLGSGEVISPRDIDGAYEIVAIDRIPMVRSTTVFVRTIYLGFRNV